MLFKTVLLVFISSISVQTQSLKTPKPTSELSSAKRDKNVDTYSITPSFSYQYHTNDHGDYDADVANSGTSRNKKKGTKDDSNKMIQWDEFSQASDPKFAYSATPVRMDSYDARPVPIDSYGPSLTPRDSYVAEPSPMNSYAPPPPLLNNYAAPRDNDVQYGTYYGGQSGGSPAPAPPSAPAAPPPSPIATIKGSIDYVLIPLILIGIAGPIFVVLYVVLGSFEAKLSPITNRSNSWGSVLTDSLVTLKPATDLFFATLARALDQNECMERTMCHVGSFGRSLGLQRLTFLNKTVEAVARGRYKKSLQMFFSSMTNKPECSAFKCP